MCMHTSRKIALTFGFGCSLVGARLDPVADRAGPAKTDAFLAQEPPSPKTSNSTVSVQAKLSRNHRIDGGPVVYYTPINTTAKERSPDAWQSHTHTHMRMLTVHVRHVPHSATRRAPDSQSHSVRRTVRFGLVACVFS